jgi:uncharacterized phage-like protein YoqJ
MKTIVITGHRLDEDGMPGYFIPNEKYNWLIEQFKYCYEQIKPDRVIQGMAIGADQIAGIAALQLGIPFEAYIPFVGQENIWPLSSKNEYYSLLAKASNKVIVCEGGYAPVKMQLRNCAMVDQLVEPDDILLACWNGKEEGGTWNCIQYAMKQKKKMVRIDPLKMTITGLEDK